MSENSIVEEKGAGVTIPSRAVVIQMLAEKFERLPELDRKIFNYGPLYLGGNAALAGLIANSFYRRALNVTQGLFTSSLPMAVLPFLTTVAMYNVAVSKPLLSGDLNCPTCVLIRGALVGAVGAGIYPIVLALPVNAGLATRYNTAPMPEKGNILRFWKKITQPVLRKMGFVIVLQVFFSTYLSSKHFDTYLKMLQLSTPDSKVLKD
ncbi:transmembrane protein 126A isoform X1 [Esox lucius]|uniref:Transmembrane protein 126A n=1 Tax=Esox lucius TaxID=8010 RepID=C1BWW6_ESOLU|nr:transmembrane protein 126A [Esox lucius]XP_010869066.1 transmembrane protein 126A isoform X1 [Esox lucius]ACO13519.1 Transmembrane protein 126A [Esox lucius]